MPNIGPLEIAIVLIVALIILGPKKLPDMGRSMGKGMREFKEAVSGNSKDDDKAELTESHADVAAEHNGTPADAEVSAERNGTVADAEVVAERERTTTAA